MVDKQAEHAAHVLDQQGFTVHHRGSGFRGRLLLGGETFSRPLTDGQERLADALALADGGAVVCLGPAGSGKTTLAVKEGLRRLDKGLVQKLVILRPTASLPNEELGFLPGSLESKLEPFFAPVVDALVKLTGERDVAQRLQKEGRLEFASLAHVRGRTFSNSFVVADELQNAGFEALSCILTRPGDGTSLALLGDPDQTDAVYGGHLDPLAVQIELAKRRGEATFLSVVRLEPRDVQRAPVVRDALPILAALRRKLVGGGGAPPPPQPAMSLQAEAQTVQGQAAQFTHTHIPID